MGKSDDGLDRRQKEIILEKDEGYRPGVTEPASATQLRFPTQFQANR